MALADDVVFVAGTPVAFPEDDLAKAYEGRMGGILWAASASTGEKLAQYTLEPAPPAWDGLAAADGLLFCRSPTAGSCAWRRDRPDHSSAAGQLPHATGLRQPLASRDVTTGGTRRGTKLVRRRWMVGVVTARRRVSAWPFSWPPSPWRRDTARRARVRPRRPTWRRVP